MGLFRRGHCGRHATAGRRQPSVAVSDTRSATDRRILMLKVSIMDSTVSILKVSIRQIKAARALLGWSQEDLAKYAGVSVPTIKRLEAVEGDIGGRAETQESLVAALQRAGIEFIAENGGGQGVRLAKRPRSSR
jgi:DNA-binding XRE family transcriptional regulator